jgi:hypothetical protein
MTTTIATTTPARPRGTAGFYLVAIAATAVSVNTSWRFFADVLGISNVTERAGMFAVLELALLACGIAMRAGVRRPNGTPGPARVLAWVLCALAAYMAVILSGPVEGFARVSLGPALALVSLHLALGIEVRASHSDHRVGKLAQILRELRERLLSRLGLADDRRDALERIRDRAAERAARLATAGKGTPGRKRRLARAIRVSGVATDPARRDRMLALIAAVQHLDELRDVQYPSPWAAQVPAELPTEVHPELPAETSPRTSGRTSRPRRHAPSPRRSPEEHRATAAQLRAQHPEISKAELSRLMGISPTRLRQIEQPTSGPVNGAALQPVTA